MKGRVVVLIVAGAVLLAGGAALVRQRASQSGALRNAVIPEETKRFFRQLVEIGGDVRVKLIEEPVKEPWRDDTNEGEDAGNGFHKIEDDDFIVYFHPGDDTVRANIVHRNAVEAVPVLAGIFGKYFHPADCNGRKLAIYLCASREEYNRLTENGNPLSIACTLLVVSPSGVLCRGIFLSPEALGVGRSEGEDAREGIRATTWHEMSHFVYYSSLDISQPLRPPMWVTEGIAEYVSGNKARLAEVNPNAIIPLGDFETDRYRGRWTSSAYWIGYTAFLFMEQKYTADGVRSFLKVGYHSSTPKACEEALGVPFEQFDRDWQSSVPQFRSSLPQSESWRVAWVGQPIEVRGQPGQIQGVSGQLARLSFAAE